MAILKSAPVAKPVLDLSGPCGNAYYLLGFVSSNAKVAGYTKEDVERIQAEMKESDYENLVKVFDSYFGDYVDVVMP